MERLAVVVFNLGGPDKPEAIEPFLFNLFKDPAIISLPGIFRIPLAKIMSRRRASTVRNIYDKIGGKSPLLEETQAQAEALQQKLLEKLGAETDDIGVFIAMRYWHPLTDEAVQAVKAFGPERILLLPLYPQYSATTTASSIKEWHRQAAAQELDKPTQAVCCYPREDGFISAVAGLLKPVLEKEADQRHTRVLFSAHGLPKKIVAKGDPYQGQTRVTAKAIIETLGIPALDWAVCYQSRVGPLEWIGPSLDAELERAVADGKGVIVVPIAFVSEHSETLVELDMEYHKMADGLGVPAFVRVPTVSTSDHFISGLARVTAGALAGNSKTNSAEGRRLCPLEHGQCPLKPETT